MSRSIVPERPGRRFGPGLLAKLVLVLLVVGVPVTLSALGGGPSFHLDAIGLWRAALLHRPGDAQVVAGWLGRVAVLMAWIGWAWLTICVLVETRAWLTGRSTVRLPASRSLQWMAAVLVGTAFAVGTAGRTPVHHVTVSVIHADPAHGGGRSAAGPGVPLIGQATRGGPGAAGQSVTPTDSDGTSAGRPGGAPSVAADKATTTGPPTVGPAPVGRHRVLSRETLWSIAESRLGQARRWREIADLNYEVVQSDGSRLTPEHWIQPGWELVLPSDCCTALPGPPPRIRGVETATETLPAHAAVGVPPTRSERGTPGGLVSPSAPVVPIGAGIVGVGVADLVDRLRRVQQRHRGLGDRIRHPEPALRAMEQRLRVGDGGAELDAVEAAIHAWSALDDREAPDCRLQSVVATDTRVRLTFDVPLDRNVPLPFRTGSEPTTVEIERAALEVSATRARRARSHFPAPALVTVGRTNDELLMVNLEGVGSLVLAGDPLANESVGRAMALELATSRWASGFDLVLIGFGAGMERCERVTVLSEAGPLSADLSWRRLTTGMRLDALGLATADAARSLDGGPGWDPVVIVCGPEVPAGDVEALLAVSEGGRCGIGIVAICGPGAPPFQSSFVIRPADSDPTTPCDVFGTLVAPQRLEHEESIQLTAVIDAAAALDELFDHAIDESCEEQPGAELAVPLEAGRSGDRPTSATRSFVIAGERAASRIDISTSALSALPLHRTSDRALPPHGPGPSDGAQLSATPEVEVAVLGPVEIRGAARKFTRAWAMELVIYLAMHPDGASNDAWATALWPERLMAPSSLHSTVSVARRSLGTAEDGSDHLPRSHGRLRLGPSVGTDWDRFQNLATSEDLECWREALTLVRGRPFDGMRSTDWSILDGTAPAIESAVVDLSGRLAGARLRAGDPRGAEWSARRGLLVSPYDERLYRMLLRAADAAGNPGGVESVMAELVRVVADEIEPIESVHPTTLALYRSLSRRPDRAAKATVHH